VDLVWFWSSSSCDNRVLRRRRKSQLDGFIPAAVAIQDSATPSRCDDACGAFAQAEEFELLVALIYQRRLSVSLRRRRRRTRQFGSPTLLMPVLCVRFELDDEPSCQDRPTDVVPQCLYLPDAGVFRSA